MRTFVPRLNALNARHRTLFEEVAENDSTTLLLTYQSKKDSDLETKYAFENFNKLPKKMQRKFKRHLADIGAYVKLYRNPFSDGYGRTVENFFTIEDAHVPLIEILCKRTPDLKYGNMVMLEMILSGTITSASYLKVLLERQIPSPIQMPRVDVYNFYHTSLFENTARRGLPRNAINYLDFPDLLPKIIYASVEDYYYRSGESAKYVTWGEVLDNEPEFVKIPDNDEFARELKTTLSNIKYPEILYNDKFRAVKLSEFSGMVVKTVENRTPEMADIYLERILETPSRTFVGYEKFNGSLPEHLMKLSRQAPLYLEEVDEISKCEKFSDYVLTEETEFDLENKLPYLAVIRVLYGVQAFMDAESYIDSLRSRGEIIHESTLDMILKYFKQGYGEIYDNLHLGLIVEGWIEE